MSEVLATPANMRRYVQASRTVETDDGPITTLARQPFAYSPWTDERYSATPGDYFWLNDDEPLTDEEGNPMVLAFERNSIETITA